MKFRSTSSDSRVRSLRLLLALACLLPLLALAVPPGWWTDRQVLDPNAAKSDFGSVNQGQLKNMAKKAYAELRNALPSEIWTTPEGQALAALVDSWNPAQTGNLDLINQGQLKAVAKKFYDVLILHGYTDAYPWTGATTAAANDALANLGQLKNLFSFDLTRDSDGDGIPDWRETKFNLNPFNAQTNLTLPQPPSPAQLVIGVPNDWQGWTRIGRSDDPGVYGSGSTSTSALYDVYANQFYLNAASGTSNIPVGNQYVTGDPTGEFTYSPGAFTGENRILGIGVQGVGSANVSGFTPTVKFALGDNTYSAATSVPGTDGRVSFSLYSHPGDFTVQFQPLQFGTSLIYRPSNITFRGDNTFVYTLPGGIGSGASYDFAFRAIPLTSSNSYQMFFDLDVMQRLYSDLTDFQTLFNRPTVAVAPGTNYYHQGIGAIGSKLTIALNGLSNNNVVFSVPPPRIPVEVLVDTNRDGDVNALDVSWKDQWTNTRGAIFVVNYDANAKLANDQGIPVPDSINFGNDGAPDFEDYVINGPEDTKDIAPLKIRAMPNLPKDYRVFLAVEEEEDMRAVHFFKKIADGETAIWSGALVAGKAPPWTDGDEELKDIEITRWVNPNMVSSDPEKKYQETREPTNDPYYTFGVEGLLLRGMKCPGGTLKDQPGRFSGEIVVGVEIRTPTGQVVGKDTVRMRVAPWLALSREQAAEEIWAVDGPGFPASAFLRQPFQKPHYSGLNDMGQVLKTFIADLALNHGNQWFQDHVEIGYTQMPGRPPKHLVFRLPYFYTETQSQPMWPVLSLLKPGVGCFQLGDKLFDNAKNERESGDYGGNIELLPPNNNRPLGTLMLGNTVSAELARFFKAQEFQWDAGLSASTPVKWLEVGHIDEGTSFLSGGRVLLADSRQAIELLEAKFPAADQDARARAVFFAKTKQAAPANGDLPAPITQLGQLTEDYDPVNAPGILRTGIDHRNGPQFQYIRFYSGGSQGHVAKVKMGDQFVTIVKGDDGALHVWDTGKAMGEYLARTREPHHTLGNPKKNDKFVLVEDTVFWRHPDDLNEPTTPAVITVKEILDDATFVGRNREATEYKLDDVRTAIASTPGGNTLRFIPVPALFFSNGSAFNPGPTNLQFAANQVYAPRQFAPASGNQRDIFEEVIKNTIPELFRFVDDWDLYHCGVGEVHCGTAEKRVLPQNKWWTTLP